MGHKISKEQIDPGVKEHIMSLVGDVSELETDVNSDIISAVNSLIETRVDNTENMGKISNAIGEPITANHSVNETVAGLGELLSQFKTNMMNNGVTVSSTDKFKQLIDKIATMAEEGSGKGIQYAEGTMYNMTLSPATYSDTSMTGSFDINYNLNFTPSIIFVNIGKLVLLDSYGNLLSSLTIPYTVSNLIHVKTSNLTHISSYAHMDGASIRFWIDNISESKCVFNYEGTTNYAANEQVSRLNNVTWYAIGVGEEDTTLRDSLADILAGKGVDVTEEDDMASLITKVDSISSGLDIISATELPSTGRENQICVITDNPVDNFVITPYNTVSNDSSIITLYTSSAADGDTVIPITSGNITNYYHVYKIRQNTIPLSSYYYNNGWIKLTSGEFIILDSYGMYNDTPFGTITNNGALFQQGYGYKLEVSSSYDSYLIQTQTVDLTNYSKIKVIISEPSDETSYFGAKNHYLGLANSNNVYPLSGYGQSFSGKGTYEVDITNYTGLGSVIVAVWNSDSGNYSCFNVSLITIE